MFFAFLFYHNSESVESALDIYREIIKDNIDYDILILDNGMEKDRIYEIVDIMLETVCTARKSVRIVRDEATNQSETERERN